WKPDLIYFNNTEIRPTTDYETMRLYGENSGNKYLDAEVRIESDNDKVRARVGASVVKDEKSGDIIVKLVNMLPVETDMEVDLQKLYPAGQGAVNSVRTVMSGKPADEKASVKTDRVTLDSPFFTIPLPPYSFTVLRLK
ncbi:MAG: alpha-L-arabinofuranosidase, partial [Muribaculaceae bacterium]|nr:alpha-L-arabinofuranosidase [Muribaculaceae bacterium]